MKRLVFAFALTLIMVATAAAQETVKFADGERRPIIHYTSKLEGVEAAPGVVYGRSAVRVGTTYATDISGPLTGHFTAVFDSAAPDPDPENGNQIVRGTWTLAVYRDGAYQGTLFGEIVSGDMAWKGTGNVMEFGMIRAELTVKGGTKGLNDVVADQAFGRFDIFWESHPKVATAALPALSGTLELAF